MSFAPSRPDRRLLPRWQLIRAGLPLMEGGSLKGGVPSVINKSTAEGIEEARREWLANPNLASSLDVLTIGSLLPDDHDVRAAALVVDQASMASVAAKSLARAILDGTGIIEQLPDDMRKQLSYWRSRLRRDPRNAIAALNLAHSYTGIGISERAEHFLHYAAILAPDNRLVLRAQTRFYLHQRDLERAHKVLLDSPRLVFDPWLVSSEMAIASLRGRPSKSLKAAQKFQRSTTVRPAHLAELKAQFAELEANHGNLKVARRFLGEALLEPTENVVAQAQFAISTHLITNVDLGNSIAKTPDAYEAAAYRAFEEKEWDYAYESALKWQRQEPFSSRPCWLAFEIAHIGFRNPELALRHARDTAELSRNDKIAVNNLAFAYAVANHIPEALETLKDVMGTIVSDTTIMETATLQATFGLLHFRQNLIDDGRTYYNKCISFFEKHKDERLASALANFAREEYFVGNHIIAINLLNKAKSTLKPTSSLHIRYAVESIAEQLGATI